MRAYHIHPDFHSGVARIYISTGESERRALKRRGWVKVRREHLAANLAAHVPATKVDAPAVGRQLARDLFDGMTATGWKAGTWYLSQPKAIYGQDESVKSAYRMVHEGLRCPGDF